MTHTTRTRLTILIAVVVSLVAGSEAGSSLRSADATVAIEATEVVRASDATQTVDATQAVDATQTVDATQAVDATQTATSPSSALTTEQQALVDWAASRFERVGLDLPDVSVTFHDASVECRGFGGLYIPSTREIRICQMVNTTMVHELAHAWIETTFDETDRQEFMAQRGLEVWADPGYEWSELGAEQAAEVITWGLMDRNILIRWIETAADGQEVPSFRLFKLPDSSPDELIAAYELLTDDSPTDRLDDDPRLVETSPMTSPEAG
jgi:hypothetical protein